MPGLQDEINRYFWFHTIDLGDGVVTAGKKSIRRIALESEWYFEPVDMAGKEVVDIGAWNGAFSFEAARRGAGRVLATDSFVWDDPTYKGRETFDIARARVAPGVEAQHIDAMEISAATLGTFDVVLFAGVFYHLKEPVEGLRRAAEIARDVLIVETHIDLDWLGRPAMAFYPGAELNGDPTNWWGPNVKFMIVALRNLGFDTIDVRRFGRRGIFHAWRNTSSRLSGSPARPSVAWARGHLDHVVCRIAEKIA